MTKLLACLALAILLAVPAQAGPFEDGVLAYKSGDYVTAIRIWRLLAEKGHARAQFNLALMSGKGDGVPKDYVKAHMWSSLAAAQRDKNGVRFRDFIASRMTPAQIAEAQKLAREWAAKHRYNR